MRKGDFFDGRGQGRDGMAEPRHMAFKRGNEWEKEHEIIKN